jgi:pimeloyl-ACP methyl ester carboxylesterase
MARPLQPEELFPAGQLEISQRFLTLGSGIRVRTVEAGPAHGMPLVCIPGWCCSAYMFRHQLRDLPSRGFRVIVAEPRGFGLSDRPLEPGAYSSNAYDRDLLALLDALELKRVALLGQSMGGGIALHAALRHPERVTSLVLINPSGVSPLRRRWLLLPLPRLLARQLGGLLAPRALVTFILRYLAYADAGKVTERDIDEYWSPTQLTDYIYAARASIGEFDWTPISDDTAASLAVPTLVMLGANDRLIPDSGRDAHRLAGATVHVMAGGHCVHEEFPDAANRLIAEFVAR